MLRFTISIGRVISVVLLLCLSACAPRPGVIADREKAGPDAVLFREAMRQVEARELATALETLDRMTTAYPRSTLIDDALLLKGRIFLDSGNMEAARTTFETVRSRFPLRDARWEAEYYLLAIRYRQGDFQGVADEGRQLLAQKMPPGVVHATRLLVGDACLSLGLPMDAFILFSKASATAEPGTSAAEVDARLQETAATLGGGAVAQLLQEVADPASRGYLLLQLGAIHAAEGDFPSAEAVLEALVERFPDHAATALAVERLEEYRRRASFDRNTIGCLLPLSGPYEIYGNRAQQGIELALYRFAQTYPDYPVNIVTRDSAGDVEVTVAAVNDLAEAGAAAIIGPISTAEFAALDAQERGVPILTLTQKDRITEIGDFVFRNFLTPTAQVESLVSYATGELGYDTFAILYPDEKYGQAFMRLFWEAVLENGGEVVGLESYQADSTDFADPVKKLVGLYYDVPADLVGIDREVPDSLPEIVREFRIVTGRPVPAKPKDPEDDEPDPVVDFDAVFMPDAPAKAGLVVPQLAFHNVEGVTLMGTNLWHSPRMIDMAGRYIQGAILADGFFSGSTSPHITEFVKDFETVYGRQPGYIEAVAFDSAMMLLNLLVQPEINSRKALRDTLASIEFYQGVTGAISFNESGDLDNVPFLLTVKGSRFKEVPLAGTGFDR